MNIGIRAHDLGSFDTPADLAVAVRSAGLDSVQLVAWKALAGVRRSPGLWTADLVRELRVALRDAGVALPLVGAYFNWFSKEERESGHGAGGLGRRLFRESLAAAEGLGATAVGTESEGYGVLPLWSSPRNRSQAAMDHAVAMVRDLHETAEETGTLLAVEGVWWHVLDTPERVRELKDRSGAHRLRFIFDPVNFLHARNHPQQREIIDRAVELYGPDLCLVHCKDFIPTPAGLLPAAPGRGGFDYPYLLRKLGEAGLSEVPLILEGVKGRNIARSVSYLRELGSSGSAPEPGPS